MNIPSDELHPLTCELLRKRGVPDEEIADFLNPSYEKHVGDPFAIHGVPQAVERIVQAMRNTEKIAVYSDYDCDGIPGGVLLREFFDGIGYPVEIYVPHRHNEGYGLHNHAIDALKENGVTLIITVDLAITNIEEVAYAKSVGVDIIVTDHHLPITEEVESKKLKVKSKMRQIVPDAVSVINSKQDICTYHDDMLCGCAVAWKLACAILSKLREAHTNFYAVESKKSKVESELKNSNDTRGSFETVLETVSKLPDGWEKWMLDLVGISTIADMVPLQKENRALAHYGLKVLRKTKRPGLLHIFNEQRMRKDYLTEDDIAFTIAPRINAAGRMGAPIQAHHMLYERNPAKAESFARDLELLNTERKVGVKDVVSTLDIKGLRPGRESTDSDVYKNDVIVVGDMSWGPGILGLIAQNIIDEIGKPTFVWGSNGVESKKLKVESEMQNSEIKIVGSCRSRGDVHVVELMARAGHDALTHWGGHEQAGGFSVSIEKLPQLSDALNDAIKHIVIKELGKEETVIDAELSMDDINEVTYNAVTPLAPFGVGNPKPVFAFTNMTPLLVRRFGKKNEHLEITYSKKGGQVKAIKFFVGKDVEEKASKPHTLLAHLEKSFFAGKIELRLKIVEIR